MKAVETSFCYRAMGSAYRWASRCAARSLIGRSLAATARAARPALSASHSLGTSRIASIPLDGPAASPAAAAFARPAFAVQEAVAHGALGRWLRSLAMAASTSGFVRQSWLRVLGAAAVGLGCGMVSIRPLYSAFLIIVGLLLAVAGPRVATAIAASGIARLFGWKGAIDGDCRGPQSAARVSSTAGFREIRGVTWVALLLALVGGVLAGAGSHTKTVLALAVIIAVVVAVFWRPQLVLLVTAAYPWVDWYARATLGGLGPLFHVALLLGSLLLVPWSVLVLRRDVPRSVPVALPLLVMLALCAGSIVVNRVPTAVGFYALRVLFVPILFYFVGFLIPKDRRWVRWTVGFFIATCTLLALHGLYQYVTHAPMPANWVDVEETDITTRAYSVVQNPNVLGAILAMGALVAGSLALSRVFAGIRRMALAAAFAVQLCGLAVTFSRGAWIGFVVGFLAMIIFAYRRYLVAVVGAGVVAWFAVPQVFVQRLVFSFSSEYVTKSTAGLGRIYRWDAALQHIADKPLLGVGLGTFGGTAAYMMGYWGIWVDNIYLQMAAEGGILLLACFLWLLLRGAKGIVRAHGLTSDPYLKALAAGVLGAFVAVVAANFFEADWETLAVGVEFWFLAGIVTSAMLVKPKAAE